MALLSRPTSLARVAYKVVGPVIRPEGITRFLTFEEPFVKSVATKAGADLVGISTQIPSGPHRRMAPNLHNKSLPIKFTGTVGDNKKACEVDNGPIETKVDSLSR